MCPQPSVNSGNFYYRILVVDNEPIVLQTSAAILHEHGYDVRTAVDGFDALAKLRRALPDLIISDLKMPNMSGFEFLSLVRRRFPQIPVIAVSGEFNSAMPVGVLADAFFKKGDYRIEELFQKIANLLEQSPIRPYAAKPDRAPVWFSRSHTGYYVLTCTECLRSFSAPAEGVTRDELQETECVFCGTWIRYLIEEPPQDAAQQRKAG
jgi:CheY-like chemotaxis protein